MYLKITGVFLLLSFAAAQTDLPQCVDCPASCRTCQQNEITGEVECTACKRGFTLDEFSFVCYKCTSTQYYDSFYAECTDCPVGVSCCTQDANGFVNICGCQTGYTLDTVNSFCYENCLAGFYYDDFYQECTACPIGANCCSLIDSVVTICGCEIGQSLDAINNICYDSCSATQYYDSDFQECIQCQNFASPCTSTTGGITTQSCCCNSGYTLDDFGDCIKSCRSNQYFNYDTGNCARCGTGVKSCTQNAIIECQRTYTLDEFNNVCYKCTDQVQYYDFNQGQCVDCATGVSCCTISDFGFVEICGCSRGYTLDEINQNCYKCNSDQYYDLSFAECTQCPGSASCCEYVDGFLSICGCPTGYTLDIDNQICYVSCTSSQYYDSFEQQCFDCPQFATSCRLVNNELTIVSCRRGYTIDSYNTLCYKNCASNFYYDPFDLQDCVECPANANCCGLEDGFLTICGCSTGYTADNFNQICYASCTQFQYYDPDFQECYDCPAGANCCTYDNGFDPLICGCRRGYTQDTLNNICYESCTSSQYYDTDFLQCTDCPGQATCCTFSNGFVTICGCPTGYSIDEFNGICYESCTSLQYYDPSQQVCASCPEGSNCCTYDQGFVSICSCRRGQSLDSVNNICYKTCTSNQYYDSFLLECQTCPENTRVCNTTVFGVTEPGCCCVTGYAYDVTGTVCLKVCTSSQYYDFTVNDCLNCPANAETCTEFGIETCVQGYTLDTFFNLCYKCTSTQYYNEETGECTACPTGSNCCEYNGFTVTLCGCRRGYTLDEFNNVCYQCTSTQYYSFNDGECINCPSCATACYVDDFGFIYVNSTISGFSWDADNQNCYASCTSKQYYDPFELSCQDCPSCALSCTYENGIFTVPRTTRGQTWDDIGQECYKSCTRDVYTPTTARCTCRGFTYEASANICYKCGATQYYDTFFQECAECPANSNCCQYVNDAIEICGCVSGYTLDAVNQVCYKCNAGQYYDTFYAECQSCPPNVDCCTYNDLNNEYTICGCASGYTLDAVNQICYESCIGSIQYYDDFYQYCIDCPAGATCCTFVNGELDICSCEAGQSIDAVNDLCYESCTATQYYDTDFLACYDCQAFSKPCTQTVGGVSILTCCCNNGFELDDFGDCIKECSRQQYYDYVSGSCLACPRNARTCSADGIIACQNTYTLDVFNDVCYKCTADIQYYNPNTAECTNCPANSNCCTYENGFLSICGCNSGYTLDEFNQVCYSCTRFQYYNSDFGQCEDCPANANCCEYIDGFVQICGCKRGFTFDEFSNVCYNCAATEYYNSDFGECQSCPEFSTCCEIDADGFLTICACASGYSLDAFSQVCYKCEANEYYNSAIGFCVSCPECSTSCTTKDGLIDVLSTTTGTSWDYTNQVCYDSCANNQYYDEDFVSCQDCPFCARSCTYVDGKFRVPRTLSGYFWDADLQTCYCATGQYLDYFDFNIFMKQGFQTKAKIQGKETKVGKKPHYLQAEEEDEEESYAGDCHDEQNFNTNYGLTSGQRLSKNSDMPFEVEVTLYGSKKTKTTTWCDHTYLYSFKFSEVKSTKHSSAQLLEATGSTMVGFSDEFCGYHESFAINFDLEADKTMATISDDFSQPCGYHMNYKWNGDENLGFVIQFKGSVATTIPALLLLVISLFQF